MIQAGHAHGAEFGTIATWWTRASPGICAVGNFGRRSIRFSGNFGGAIVDGAIRVETSERAVVFTDIPYGYGETYFGGPCREKGIGRTWPIFTESAASMKCRGGTMQTPLH